MRQRPSSFWFPFSFVFASLSLLLAGGCGVLKIEYQVVTGPDDSFVIQLPRLVEPVEPADPETLISAGNVYQDFFLTLRRDDQVQLEEKFPDWGLMDYYDFHMENLLLNIQEPIAPGPDSLLVSRFPTLYGGYQGYFKGDALAFRLAVVETPLYQYQLLMWTRQDRMEEYRPVMDSILRSFKPMNTARSSAAPLSPEN